MSAQQDFSRLVHPGREIRRALPGRDGASSSASGTLFGPRRGSHPAEAPGSDRLPLSSLRPTAHGCASACRDLPERFHASRQTGDQDMPLGAARLRGSMGAAFFMEPAQALGSRLDRRRPCKGPARTLPSTAPVRMVDFHLDHGRADAGEPARRRWNLRQGPGRLSAFQPRAQAPKPPSSSAMSIRPRMPRSTAPPRAAFRPRP